MPLFSSGRARVPVDHGVALLDRNVDGITTLTAPIDGGILMLQAFAVDDATLAALADETAIDSDGLASDAPFTSRGLQLLAAADPDVRQTSSLTTSLGFGSVSDPGRWISVSSGGALPPFERAVQTFMRRDAHVAAVGGVRTAVVGRDARSDDWLTAFVDFEGIEVTVSGNVGEDELLAVARTLRVATDDEWHALRAASAKAQSDPSRQITARRFMLRSGTMTSAATWKLSLQSADAKSLPPYLTVEMTGSTTGQFVGSTGGGSELDESLAAGQPGIQPIATTAGIVLVAAAPRDQRGARLVVTAGELTLTDELTDPDANAPGLFGAVGYGELVPYHAELLGADGTVLATLDGL
ncbi:MAG: hypothetical protein QM733_04275 [Ilumatobacteraceae bacterium]